MESGRARWLSALCGVIALGLAAFFVVQWTTSTQPGGDPHGQILAELKPVASAVLPGSTEVTTQYIDSTWHGKCPDNPSGSSGWYAVRVNAQFVSPVADVANTVGGHLEHLGWVRRDTQAEAGQGSIAHWTKRLKHGVLTDAYAYPVPQNSDAAGREWILSATADPPGYSLPGC